MKRTRSRRLSISTTCASNTITYRLPLPIIEYIIVVLWDMDMHLYWWPAAVLEIIFVEVPSVAAKAMVEYQRSCKLERFVWTSNYSCQQNLINFCAIETQTLVRLIPPPNTMKLIKIWSRSLIATKAARTTAKSSQIRNDPSRLSIHLYILFQSLKRLHILQF